MTELSLICAIAALGLAFAVSIARWLRSRPAHDPDLARVATMVSGGAGRYLRRQTAVSLAVAAAVGAIVFLAYGVAYQTEAVTDLSPREFGTWTSLSYIVGAVFAVLAAWVGAWASRQASVRVAAGTRRSLDESLQIAIRAGAVPGVVVCALAALGLAGLFLAMLLAAGASAWERAARFPLLLPGFALGAAFVALLSQLGGGIFATVADVGADVAGGADAQTADPDAENPAAIADLVGDTVGDGAACATAVLAAAASESLAAMLAAALVFRKSADLPSVTAFVLFPLVARTFGLLSAAFGVLVVRTDDTEVPMNALARGLYVTTLLYAVGAVGCAKWLLEEHWIALGGCAVLGAAASLLCLFVAQYYSEQRYRPVRALAEAARAGPTLAALRGLFTAVEGTAVLLLLAVATGVGAYRIGASTGLSGGGLLGIAIAVGGLLGSAPYVLAMVSFGSITDTAGGIIEMTVASERPDVRARAHLLDAVGTTAKAFARSLSAVASTLSCLLLVALFLYEVVEQRGTGGAGALVDATRPSLYLGGLLGLVVILAFVWLVLLRVVNAARQLILELRAQLASTAPARAEPLAPDGTPTHVSEEGVQTVDPLPVRRASTERDSEARQLACVEIVSRIALRGMLAPAIVGVGAPFLVGVGLRLMADGDRVTASAEAIVALLVVATIAGALGSFLFTNAGSAWDNAKKYIETGAHGGRSLPDALSQGSRASDPATPPLTLSAPRGEIDNPTYVAAVVGDTIGDPLKGAVGPAAQALVKTLAALALVFLPFFL